MYKNSAKAAPMLRTEIKHAAAGGLVLLAALVGSLAPLAASSPEQGKRLALTYCAKMPCHRQGEPQSPQDCSTIPDPA
jgi:hypothetical protein